MAITAKKWVYLDDNTDEGKIRDFSEQLGVPTIVAKVMANRGIENVSDAKKFIDRSVKSLHSPFLMKDMEKAVARIKSAIKDGEQITVYGDYDVDGITSTALLSSFLRKCGAIVTAYIPDRLNEGYGVNCEAIDKIANLGTSLIVTVDTGTTASTEILYAKSKGIDVVVTDHHECKEKMPEAFAIVNPHRADCAYPFKDLAGVGVAFKLICALSDEETEKLLDEYSDIVALGTIADVVSLTDENRVLAGTGLEKLSENPNLGLSEVVKTIGTNPKWNSSAVVSYSIAPRINAAGRMSSAMTAVNLLLTESRSEAEEYAQRLDEANKERQVCEGIIFAQAEKMLEDEKYADKKVFVLAKEGWHHGIIGIVASRICDKYQKSCILISVEDGRCKASGRSVEGVNLFEALSQCADILENFGGHAYAAGFCVKKENIDQLDIRLNQYADSVLPKVMSKSLFIDARVEINDVTLKDVSATTLLGPYGAGNKTPMFAILSVKIVDIRSLSDGKHCRIVVKKDNSTLEIIAFGQGRLVHEYKKDDVCDIAGEMNINIYNSQSKVQMVLVDIRLSGTAIPDRADFERTYRYFKSIGGMAEDYLMEISRRIGDGKRRPMPKGRMENILQVFEDVGLLAFVESHDMMKIKLLPQKSGTKVSIDKSEVYKEICKSK